MSETMLATEAKFERYRRSADIDRVRCLTGNYNLLDPSEELGQYVFTWRTDAPESVRATKSCVVSMGSFRDVGPDDIEGALDAIRESTLRHDKRAWCDAAEAWIEEQAEENRRRFVLERKVELERELADLDYEIVKGYIPPRSHPCQYCVHYVGGVKACGNNQDGYWDCFEVVERRPRPQPSTAKGKP